MIVQWSRVVVESSSGSSVSVSVISVMVQYACLSVVVLEFRKQSLTLFSFFPKFHYNITGATDVGMDMDEPRFPMAIPMKENTSLINDTVVVSIVGTMVASMTVNSPKTRDTARASLRGRTELSMTVNF